LLAAAGEPPEEARDPIFGLSFQPAHVHFDPAPADLVKTCPDLVNARFDRRMWVFARLMADGADTMVIGGFYVARGGSGAKMFTDPQGAMLQRTDHGCVMIGPARESFDYKPDELDAAALQRLAADAVQRYSRAYGSLQAFQTQLRVQHADLSSPHSAVLRDAMPPH